MWVSGATLAVPLASSFVLVHLSHFRSSVYCFQTLPNERLEGGDVVYDEKKANFAGTAVGDWLECWDVVIDVGE